MKPVKRKGAFVPDEFNPSEADWARLAAFIDGEGCIDIHESPYMPSRKKRSPIYIRIHVSNTDPRLFKWCQDNFGGTLQLRNKQRQGWRNCYVWFASCRRAAWILQNCLPYFVLKRDQAELGLAFVSTQGAHGIKTSPEVLARRRELQQKLSDIKWKSHDGSVTRRKSIPKGVSDLPTGESVM
jgi:hypothetical protein